MNTGFKDLDEIIDLKKGELIVIASRPSMGKSTFVLNILSHIALEEKKSVLLFNLEASKENIMNKLIISNSMIEVNKFELYDNYKKNKKIKPKLIEDDLNRIEYGINLLRDAPIYIASDRICLIDDIYVESRKLKEEKNIEAIIIDYLQLIQFDKKKLLSRDNEITEILRKLKILAKELNLPIIVTSQLSRKCETRDNKRPIISDFSNSRYGILTYSSKILFLYRDSYYNRENKSNIAELIIAKNNEGNTSTIELAWLPEYCTFSNTIAFHTCDIGKNKLPNFYTDETLKLVETTEVDARKGNCYESAKIYNMSKKKQEEIFELFTCIYEKIDKKEIKQIETNFYNDIYVLTIAGKLYKTKKYDIHLEFLDEFIEKIFYLEGINLYKITQKNIILPIEEKEQWNNTDKYLNNNNCTYKKIETSKMHIVLLTDKGNVRALCGGYPCLGILPDNFIEVEDITIIEDENGIDMPYIYKNNNFMKLYIE